MPRPHKQDYPPLNTSLPAAPEERLPVLQNVVPVPRAAAQVAAATGASTGAASAGAAGQPGTSSTNCAPMVVAEDSAAAIVIVPPEHLAVLICQTYDKDDASGDDSEALQASSTSTTATAATAPHAHSRIAALRSSSGAIGLGEPVLPPLAAAGAAAGGDHRRPHPAQRLHHHSDFHAEGVAHGGDVLARRMVLEGLVDARDTSLVCVGAVPIRTHTSRQSIAHSQPTTSTAAAALAAASFEGQHAKLYNHLSKLEPEKRPLVLGGGSSLAIPSIADGLRRYGSRLRVVWFGPPDDAEPGGRIEMLLNKLAIPRGSRAAAAGKDAASSVDIPRLHPQQLLFICATPASSQCQRYTGSKFGMCTTPAFGAGGGRRRFMATGEDDQYMDAGQQQQQQQQQQQFAPHRAGSSRSAAAFLQAPPVPACPGSWMRSQGASVLCIDASFPLDLGMDFAEGPGEMAEEAVAITGLEASASNAWASTALSSDSRGRGAMAAAVDILCQPIAGSTNTAANAHRPLASEVTPQDTPRVEVGGSRSDSTGLVFHVVLDVESLDATEVPCHAKGRGRPGFATQTMMTMPATASSSASTSSVPPVPAPPLSVRGPHAVVPGLTMGVVLALVDLLALKGSVRAMDITGFNSKIAGPEEVAVSVASLMLAVRYFAALEIEDEMMMAMAAAMQAQQQQQQQQVADAADAAVVTAGTGQGQQQQQPADVCGAEGQQPPQLIQEVGQPQAKISTAGDQSLQQQQHHQDAKQPLDLDAIERTPSRSSAPSSASSAGRGGAAGGAAASSPMTIPVPLPGSASPARVPVPTLAAVSIATGCKTDPTLLAMDICNIKTGVCTGIGVGSPDYRAIGTERSSSIGSSIGSGAAVSASNSSRQPLGQSSTSGGSGGGGSPGRGGYGTTGTRSGTRQA